MPDEKTVAEYLTAHPELPSTIRDRLGEHSLWVGMDKAHAALVCEGLIEELHTNTWKLKHQYGRFEPGLYPYFSSREVYLYFSKEELVAIIVRGSYNVYP